MPVVRSNSVFGTYVFLYTKLKPVTLVFPPTIQLLNLLLLPPLRIDNSLSALLLLGQRYSPQLPFTRESVNSSQWNENVQAVC